MTEVVVAKERKSLQERQKQLLEALIRLLNSDDGMGRITTKRLALELGLSEAALYRYFPQGKAKMFEALIENIELTLSGYINASKKQENGEDSVKAILFTVVEFARKNPGVTRILTGHALMFEEDSLKQRVAKFFDNLELQFFNLLQLHRLLDKNAAYNERELAGFLVNFCEGQFLRLVRSNFRASSQQAFDKQWAMLQPLFQGN